MVPLAWSKGSRDRPWQESQRPEGGVACHCWGPVSGLHLQPQSPQGLGKKKKEGTATKHHMLLLSLPREHTHPAAATAKYSGQCPGTWSLSLPKTLPLGAASAATPAWAKWDRVLLAWSVGGRGKPLQFSLTPEVGMAQHHWGYLKKNHLRPQPPQRALQRRTLRQNTTCCCFRSLGSTPALLLPLPNTLGSAQTLDHCLFPGT